MELSRVDDLGRLSAYLAVERDRQVDGAVHRRHRVYVQAGIYDRFVQRFVEATARLKVGSGLEDGVTQGPLIDEAALEKTEEFVADAREKGGRVIVGGVRRDHAGLFYPPTVIADAHATMRFSREEIFGPVAPVFRFDSEDDAIRLANDTEFGLACYFYTNDLGRTHRVSERLAYGIVGVHEGLITTEVAPFGGHKQSGLGQEGSKYGISDYLNVKYTCIGGLAR